MEVAEFSLTQGIGRNNAKWKHLVWSITIKHENLNSTTKKALESKLWSISDYKEVCGINLNINYPWEIIISSWEIKDTVLIFWNYKFQN